MTRAPRLFGTFLLLAGCPANLVRSYAIDLGDGLVVQDELSIGQPAFIALAEVQP